MTSCTEMAFFPTNFMLQTTNSNDQEEEEDPQHHHHHHHHDLHNNHPPISLSPFFPPCTTTTSHHDFHGLGKRSNMSFSGGIEASTCDHHHQEGNIGEDELSDDGSLQLGGEKKRRLNLEQVKTLEKNFELGNKLEPERKMQLARALGLQPRQIAIWFQNRRARWKTKQLEKDYDLLKRQFDALKADNDALQAQNHKLQSQLLALKAGEHHIQSTADHQSPINLNKLETDQESDESSSDVVVMKLDISMMPNSSSSAGAGGEGGTTNLFPPPPPPPAMRTTMNGHQQLLFQHGPSPNSSAELHHCTKITNNDPSPTPAVKEETFTNMFCGIDVDQTGFWPWLEPHHFN